jgi:hypothetical protein
MTRVFLLGCWAILAVARAGDPAPSQSDFRKANWGMTRAQVLATETAQPREVRESTGEVIMRYDSLELGQPSRVVYIFANDKLVRAKYVFDGEHADPNDFIRDFRTIEPLLRAQHGNPVSDRAFWGDDKFQDEPKSYLQQDRAAATDILPSDPLMGLSIAAGHLKLYTGWQENRTKISHGLTGENSRITHQIEFLSVDLEKLEEQVRSASQPN